MGDLFDNALELTLPVYIQTDISIKGYSEPETLHYFMDHYTKSVEEYTHEQDIGPEVVHVFHVENDGPSDTLGTDIYIMWPAYTNTGDRLLYLTEQPYVEKGYEAASCDYVAEVNSLH